MKLDNDKTISCNNKASLYDMITISDDNKTISCNMKSSCCDMNTISDDDMTISYNNKALSGDIVTLLGAILRKRKEIKGDSTTRFLVGNRFFTT